MTRDYDQMSELTLVNWNVWWATPRSRRFAPIRDRIASHSPDIVCITEGQRAILPDGGHVVDSEADYGYANAPAHRRKVLLWSREPWSEVDQVGDASLPTGRFVSGVTSTPIGTVRILGLCIPWRDAHVRTGRCDREPWEDHLDYLDGLRGVLGKLARDTPALLAGDFNQQVPCKRVPRRVFDVLIDVFADWSIVTEGEIPGTGRQTIDHIAIDGRLVCGDVRGWHGQSEDGMNLSDHDGVIVRLMRD